MAAVELCRNTNSLAHSDVVISRHQPGVYLGGKSSGRGITNPWEEIKVSGVVESVDSGVGPAAGGEFDWVARPHCVPDSGLQGSLDTTEERLDGFSLSEILSPELSPRQLGRDPVTLHH